MSEQTSQQKLGNKVVECLIPRTQSSLEVNISQNAKVEDQTDLKNEKGGHGLHIRLAPH